MTLLRKAPARHVRFSKVLFSAVAANAIRFSSPVQFAEAQQRRDVLTVLPTNLSSDELSGISRDLLERAQVSARVASAEYLQEISDVVDKFLAGDINLATARLQLKQKLDWLGYTPDAESAGKITDFASDARVNLVVRTNAQMAQGYGAWMQGQNAAVLDQWPAQELYRAYARKVPRDWIERWLEAGGEVYGDRMIALKNSPIWEVISRFGTPYPPFDFNSGMSVRDVDRKTAESLGIIRPAQKVQPQTRGFNEDLKLTPDIRDAALRQALEELGYRFDGDVLTMGENA